MTKVIDKNTVKESWDAVMDESKNPLRFFPLMTAHMLMQVLAWMWSAIFAVAVGSFMVFGISLVAHVAIIAGLVATLEIFRRADVRDEI